MKLQELLDKHKHKLWDGGYNQLVIDNEAWENYQGIIIDGRVNDNPMSEFSLSDLLFSTPFLSLLEWENADSDFVTYDYDVYGILSPSTRRLSTHEHHKINLVLLNTDEERIKYIEQFTL